MRDTINKFHPATSWITTALLTLVITTFGILSVLPFVAGAMGYATAKGCRAMAAAGREGCRFASFDRPVTSGRVSRSVPLVIGPDPCMLARQDVWASDEIVTWFAQEAQPNSKPLSSILEWPIPNG